MRLLCLILFCCALFAKGGYAQKSSAVRKLEQQRKEALADIEQTNQLLQETSKSAKSSLNRLNLLSKQILSRKKVISLLNQELDEIEKELMTIQGEIRRLRGQLCEKQENYGKSMRGLYKRHSAQDKLLFVLSAETFSQSLRRIRYLQEYADWQKRQAKEIIAKQQEIDLKKQEMEKTQAEKRALLGTRQEESKKLQSEEAVQKEEVQQLNKKQKDLKAELRKKQEIARAEAEARAAREKAERAAREQAAKRKSSGGNTADKPMREERVAATKGGYAMTKEERLLSDNFGSNRGKLPYPVTGRYTVVATFGEQQHSELKYVRTSNSGIDIQTAPGADARAVFNGVVTRVFVVPGYNNSVIVRHGNYLTVYSNLSQVYVKAGDAVSTRQALGKIYSDPEEGQATILHFQLWKEKTKLNPLPWLD